MKRLFYGLLGFAFLSISYRWGMGTVSVLHAQKIQAPIVENIVIVVGEGGTSGTLFDLAANTYQREHGGEVLRIHDGDEWVLGMRNNVAAHGPITHMEYFGHGNEVGLFVNQEYGVHGGIYAYDVDSLVNYRAASIYELPKDTFVEGASILFNGCNVAKGYPEKTSLAQSFANHFGVTVEAPLGPTEFTFDSQGHSTLEDLKDLPGGYSGDLYMIPTYEEKAFVTVFPQPTTHYDDLHEGQSYYEDAVVLLDRGLSLDFSQGFQPYRYITGAEALAFCQAAFGDKCVGVSSSEDWVRNLYALSMLVDAKGVVLEPTQKWRDAYLSWATQRDVLTEDFVNRTWYTRGEMAELTVSVLESQL